MKEHTEQPEALPCPFCGGHSTLDSNGQDFRVFCWDCGAKSKEFDCWQKAEAAWNRRAPVSQARVPLRTSNNPHEYTPNPKYPWFCRKCGYAKHDPLMHGITQEQQG